MEAAPALFDTDSVRRLQAELLAGQADPDALMELAGQAAWRLVLQTWPSVHRIAVVCGPGGNGGDGYVLARLAHESGRHVVVVASGTPSHAGAARVAARFGAAGGQIVRGPLPADAGLVVDALLGIGLDGPPREEVARLIDMINAYPAPVLSLDAPSGLAERAEPGPVVDADLTLEFLLPKLFLRTGAALDAAGALHLAPLGAAPPWDGSCKPAARMLTAEALTGFLPARRADSHKGDFGKVLCIGGDEGMGGAVLLCAEAAVRAGAGLVRVHTRASHAGALLARLPEAMLSDPAEAPDWSWTDAVALGPGLGRQAWGRALLEQALASGVRGVIDADGLNLLAEAPRPVPGFVLTPHPAEAARLLGVSTGSVQSDRPAAARELSARFGTVVVLKGAGTVVAGGQRTPRLIAAGNPGLATAGSGDVLTGVIAALLGQGLAPFDAAACGALMHAAAGDDVARHGGARGLRASDLFLPLRLRANPA